MIRIVGKGYRPKAEELVGRWVLRDGMFVYPSFGHPRVVTSVSGQRLYVDEQRPVRNLEPGKVSLRYEAGGEREPDGYVTLGTVACVCYTEEDVNLVLAENRRSEREFDEYKRNASARFAALDGEGTPEASITPRR